MMQAIEARPLALADHAGGHGDAMILMHGGSGSHRHWDRVFAPLARHFEVHAPDLPGFGQSPDAPEPASGDAYVALAAASLARLVPARRVHLVGFSFGGAVAAAVARAWGARVHRLSLIAPGGFGPPEGRPHPTRSRKVTDSSDAALRAVARHNLGVTMLADVAAIDDATVDLQLWNLAHARYDSHHVSYQRRLLDDIARIAAPLQLIWGEHDVFARPSLQARAERVRAARPDVRLDVVAGAGHWCQHECPDAVVRLLLDFHAPRGATPETA